MTPIIATYPHFTGAIKSIQQHLRQWGVPLETESWQGQKKPPEFFEALNVSFSVYIPTKDQWVKQIGPNQPWADDHFLERIGGSPLNPGKQWVEWPMYKNNPKNDTSRDGDGKFSHTYMERHWPRYANVSVGNKPRSGIRFMYGDTGDLVNVLKGEPYTRQAYLPIWFPEDLTAAVSGKRVPCTLGYHFIRRGDVLNITYYIRSCDFFRHFRDDIYLACKLLSWVLTELKTKDDEKWHTVNMGMFTMHITSLHIFHKEYNLLRD